MDISKKEFYQKFFNGEDMKGYTVVEHFPLQYPSEGMTIKMDAKILAEMTYLATQ